MPLLLVTAETIGFARHLATSLKSDVAMVEPGHIDPALSRTASMLLIDLTADAAQYEAIESAMSTSIPVLAIPRHMSELPRRALMALDFSESSVHAAKVALNLLARPAQALMVSVGAAPEPYTELLFDTVEDLFRPAHDVAIARYAVAGEIAAALLRVAATQSVDVISVGRCGRSAVTCAKPRGVGHVARAILASASCGVLIAPAPRVAQ